MPDGTHLIRADHDAVDACFAEYAAIPDAMIASRIFGMLMAHDDAEAAALYPLAEHLLGPEAVTPSVVAHRALKQTLDRIRGLEGAPFDAAMETLHTLVVRHVEEEERTLLPALESAATADQLRALGARITAAKQRVG